MNEPFDTLLEYPEQLRLHVQALDDDALHFRPAPGEWSALEVVGHLGDVEERWDERLTEMLQQDHPSFAPFDPDAIAVERDHQHQQLDALLTRFASRRAAFVARLRGLSAAELARTGMHPVRGNVAASGIAPILAGHDQIHRTQIENNMQAYEQRDV